MALRSRVDTGRFRAAFALEAISSVIFRVISRVGFRTKASILCSIIARFRSAIKGSNASRCDGRSK